MPDFRSELLVSFEQEPIAFERVHSWNFAQYVDVSFLCLCVSWRCDWITHVPALDGTFFWIDRLRTPLPSFLPLNTDM